MDKLCTLALLSTFSCFVFQILRDDETGPSSYFRTASAFCGITFCFRSYVRRWNYGKIRSVSLNEETDARRRQTVVFFVTAFAPLDFLVGSSCSRKEERER